jgi:hypothetical protein
MLDFELKAKQAGFNPGQIEFLVAMSHHKHEADDVLDLEQFVDEAVDAKLAEIEDEDDE